MPVGVPLAHRESGKSTHVHVSFATWIIWGGAASVSRSTSDMPDSDMLDASGAPPSEIVPPSDAAVAEEEDPPHPTRHTTAPRSQGLAAMVSTSHSPTSGRP